MMGVMFMKKIGFLFLLLFASLLSTSLAVGRGNMFPDRFANEEEYILRPFKVVKEDGSTSTVLHKRILKVNTNDYGTYDPAPVLVQPPCKQTPH